MTGARLTRQPRSLPASALPMPALQQVVLHQMRLQRNARDFSPGGGGRIRSAGRGASIVRNALRCAVVLRCKLLLLFSLCRLGSPVPGLYRLSRADDWAAARGPAVCRSAGSAATGCTAVAGRATARGRAARRTTADSRAAGGRAAGGRAAGRATAGGRAAGGRAAGRLRGWLAPRPPRSTLPSNHFAAAAPTNKNHRHALLPHPQRLVQAFSVQDVQDALQRWAGNAAAAYDDLTRAYQRRAEASLLEQAARHSTLSRSDSQRAANDLPQFDPSHIGHEELWTVDGKATSHISVLWSPFGEDASQQKRCLWTMARFSDKSAADAKSTVCCRATGA